MNRIKSYDVPHKGLRNALSQLSLMAGKTDYTDAQEVEELYRLGEDVFGLLTIHAKDENEVTLAELERRCEGCSDHDVHDHEELYIVQNKLEKLLLKIYTSSKAGQTPGEDGAEFYLAFSEFHSIYLEHTAEEERVTQPLLWKHFTDEELAGHRGKIMSSLSPKMLLIWFRFVFPAQSHPENLALLAGFKSMAPPPFFEEGMQVIRQALTPSAFYRLTNELV